MTDSPADPPPWQTGPPPGYHPPEIPPDPVELAEVHAKGRAVCIAVLEAATGKTKTADGRWVERDTTTEGA